VRRAARCRSLERLGVLLFLPLAACEHTSPFPPGAYGPEPPAFSGSARLTYNPGVDWTPAWLPDGSGILYSIQRLDRGDLDRCLGLLPGAGGTLVRVMCHRTAAADDSTDVFEAPAPAPDGRLVYVRASSSARFRSLSPNVQAVVLATTDEPDEFRALRSLPYAAGTRQHQGVSHIRWLGDRSIVYLAERVAYAGACGGCPPDTLRWGREIATLTWTATTADVTVVPGTAEASSVSLGGSADTIYYTLNGDSRVFRRALASGVVDVAHDFGAGRTARDAEVVAGRLVAVVGGKVSYADVPGIGPMQRDEGGELFVVELSTGAETAVPLAGRWFRRPRLRQAGDRLVAETYAYTITPIAVNGTVVRVDTTVGRVGDLWLLATP
jgi:hypothetical protein